MYIRAFYDDEQLHEGETTTTTTTTAGKINTGRYPFSLFSPARALGYVGSARARESDRSMYEVEEEGEGRGFLMWDAGKG